MSDFCKERTPVEVPPTTGTVVNCSICGEELLSKRKLFTHLEEVHDFVNENAKPVKVGCLVGWISSETSDVERYLRTESEEESREDLLTGNGTTKRKVETLLFDAIREVFDTKATTAKDNDENKGESKDKEDSSNSNSNRVGTGSGHTKSSSAISAEGSTARLAGHTKGLTRGSQPERSTVSHALERTSHSIADLFLFQLQRPPGNEQAWLDRVNAVLKAKYEEQMQIQQDPNSNLKGDGLPIQMEVLTCKVLPGKGSELSGFNNCSQRRLECLLPLSLVLPPSAEEHAKCATHLVDPDKDYKPKRAQNWKDSLPPADSNTHSHNQTYSQGRLDSQFPIDTPEGQRRVAFFRILKAIMKQFGGRFQMFHNFASGGICPDDGAAQRYHKSMLIHPDANSPPSEEDQWVQFSITGDNFLRGQVRRLIGLCISLARGWLPEDYVDLVMRHSTVTRDLRSEKETLEKRRLGALQREQRMLEELSRKKPDEGEGEGEGVSSTDTATAAATGTDTSADTGADTGADNGAEGDKGRDKGKGKGRDKSKEKPKKKKARVEVLVPTGTVPFLKPGEPQNGPGLSMGAVDAQGHSLNPQHYRNLRSHQCDKEYYCEALLEVPAVPALGIYVQECKYANYEAKYEKQEFFLDPRRKRDRGEEWLTESDKCSIQRIEKWEARVHSHIMRSPAMQQQCSAWATTTEAQCTKLLKKGRVVETMISRSPVKLTEMHESAFEADRTSLQRCPEHYKKVLRLLQEADQSGHWPVSSKARLGVMVGGAVGGAVGGTDETTNTATTTADTEKSEEEKQKGEEDEKAEIKSGTFSVGAFPKGTAQPKGNLLFPELTKACFELERLICPDRPPSGTIAINRHAQFKPHRDSGAGSGQTRSAIVALGDFTGGELGVETDVPADIRYQPLEFDGWSQRHYTLPFCGERYSLVWFTPLGVGEEDMWWWKN